MDSSNLAKRMKTYENVPKNSLIRRMPVVIRIDGRAFHTFTKGFKKPFDNYLMMAMQETMKYLCENIQGCVLGYTQSDEISLVLVDYKKFESSAWFDNEVQKMCSIAASMATLEFNRVFRKIIIGSVDMKMYHDSIIKGAMFDARCFNLSKEEVTNYIYWRQLDATRNSIQMVGQANFSHRQLQSKNCNEIQEMLFQEKGVNWNDFQTVLKRGSCCIKEESDERSSWIIDEEIPIFTGDGREYIEKLIYVGE